MKRGRALALSLLALACGPVGPLPGGELAGTPSAPPSDWAAAAAEETVQLETRPSDPYSVNLWVVGLEGGFYVASSRGGEATWAENIQADPNVRLKIGDRLYALRAERVTDQAEIERFSEGLKAKYDFEASPEQRDQAWIFRLVPR